MQDGVRTPWPAWATWLWALLSLSVALQYLLTLTSPYDETAQMVQAWRWAQGEVMYRDVFEFAGPLPLAVNALLDALLGYPWMEGTRLLAGCFAAALLWSIARFAWLMGVPPALALAASFGVAFGALPGYRAYYHHWVAWAFVVAAMVVVAKAMLAAPRSEASPWPWAIAGALAALASMSTVTMGFLAVGTVGAGALVSAWCQALSWRRLGLRVGLLVVAFLLPWALLLAYFAWHGAAGAMLHQVWVWPFTHYRSPGNANDVWPLTDLDMRFFPMKYWGVSPWAWAAALITGVGTGVLPFFAGLAAFGVLAAQVWAWLWQGRRPGGVGQAAFMLAVALVLEGLHVVMGRGDLSHLRFGAPLAFVAWALWGTVCWRQAKALRLGPVALALAVPTLSFLGFTSLATASDWRTFRGEWRAGKVGLGLTERFRSTALVQLLLQHVPPGGRVTVYPGCAPALLLGGAPSGSSFTTLLGPEAKYNDAVEYARFRAEWKARPPEAVVLLSDDAARTLAHFGGEPNLKAYRFWGQFPGFPGDESSVYQLWVKDSIVPPPLGPPRP